MRLFEPFASNPVRSHAVRPRFPGERRGERHMLPTASRPTQGLPEFVARVGQWSQWSVGFRARSLRWGRHIGKT